MSVWKEEQLKGRFWILNKFVREYARNLSVQAQMIYVCLCCYAGTKDNEKYETFVGYRRIADNLNLNKDTVMKHIKQLEASGLIRRLEIKNGKATSYRINTDLEHANKPSGEFGHKDYKDIKEDNLTKERYGYNELREDLIKKGIVKSNPTAPLSGRSGLDF